MLKKLFNKKSDDSEESKDKSKDTSSRPKIVIKQRRTSSAPIPNSIANTMSPNSMPKEEIKHDIPDDEIDEVDESPAINSEESSPTQEVSPTIQSKGLSEAETLKFEAKIAELKAEKAQLLEKTKSLVEEGRELHASLDKLEKSSSEEKILLQEELENQKNNYSALEDEFLRRKDEMDEMQDELEQLDEDYQSVVDELESLQDSTVPKKDLLHIQSKLREESRKKEDLDTQVHTLKKDQSRYETMVTELSAHITELKDSLDKGSDEQINKLMAVKDQEIVRFEERISELEKNIKDESEERKSLQKLLNDKEALIDSYQEYETKYIDAAEQINELSEQLEIEITEKLAVGDELSLLKSDFENVEPKIKTLEEKVQALKLKNEALLKTVKEQSDKLASLNKDKEFLEGKIVDYEADNQKGAEEFSTLKSELEGKIEGLEKELNSTKEELAKKIELSEESGQALSDTEKELEAANAMLAENQAIVTSIEKSAEDKEAKILSLTTEIEDLLKQNKHLSASIQEQESERIGELEAEIVSFKSQISELSNDDRLETFQKDFNELEEKYNAKLKSEELLQENLENLRKEIASLKAINESKDSSESDEINALNSRISELEKSLEKVNEADESDQLKSEISNLQSRYNESLKTEEKLMNELENLKKELTNKEDSSESENPELSKKLEELETEKIDLQAKYEKAQANITEKDVTIQSLTEQIESLEQSISSATEESSVSVPETYVMNLVMKPDNDEYELELPSNMNGKEIKLELTDAGLLEEGKSYDLYLPRIDKYLMNDEFLHDCKLDQGETLEIIPG